MRPPPALLKDAANEEKVVSLTNIEAELRAYVTVLVWLREKEPVRLVECLIKALQHFLFGEHLKFL